MNDTNGQEVTASKRTKLLFKNLNCAVIIGTTIALLLSYVQSHVLNPIHCWAWFAAVLVVNGGRYGLGFHYTKHVDDSERQAHRYEQFFYAGVIATGLLWGTAGVLLFPIDSVEHQLFLAFALVAVCTNVVSAFNPNVRYAVTFIALTLAPIFIQLSLGETMIAKAGAIMTLISLAVMFHTSTALSNSVRSVLLANREASREKQETLRKRNLFHLVLENIPERVFWKGRDLRYLGANALFRKDVGLNEATDIVGKSDSEILWNGSSKEYLKAEQEIINKGIDSVHYEESTQLSSGIERWTEVNKVPIKNSSGEIEGILGTYHDISRQKRVENTLRLAATAFETHEAISIADKKGIIISVNKAFCEVTGYSADEVIGNNPSILSSGKHDIHFYEEMWRSLIKNGRWSGEVINRRKNGEEYVEQLSITAVQGENGTVENYVAVFSDLSEKKEVERQLRQAQKMDAVGTLVSGIAHEFNNMLVGISGNVFLARESVNEGSTVDGMLETADNICFKAADLVNQLLTFARKDKAMQQHSPIDLSTWLDEGLKLSQASIPKDTDLQYHNETENLFVLANTTQLQQIIINLLNNARDSSSHRDAPWIKLQLSSGDADKEFRLRHKDFNGYEFVQLTVQDNGTGIPADKLEKIFEPFYTTKEVGKGTGLGLAVIQSIMHSLHGCMEVTSVEGEGTAFHLFFPKLKPDAAKLDHHLPNLKINHGNGERILIADDEPDVLMMTTKILQDLGYHTVTASDGQEAVEIFKADPQQFDLLLLDVVMPTLNGPRAAIKMRSLRPDIPLIFYTGYSHDEMSDSMKELDRFKMIAKPFRVVEISQLIHKMIT